MMGIGMRETFEKRLNGLNESQRKAVEDRGNVLVLAGAGSGKTTMATVKVGGFLYEGAMPKEVLMMTFTNKAANEMGERIALLHPEGDKVLTLTFHALCIQYIRNNLNLVGRRKGFVIVDDKDQEAIIKILCKDESLVNMQGYGSLNEENSLTGKISAFKNKLTTFDIDYESLKKRFSEAEIAVFRWYEEKLRYMNGIDFDDIIRYAIAAMKQNTFSIPEFEHIVIDEFQDTNVSQLELVTMIGSKIKSGGTITVVGDDDQSIYQWRGANPSGMRTFMDQFSARMIKLEHNYRSSDIIVNAANQLIESNSDRLGKTMLPVHQSSTMIDVVHAMDMYEEAEYIASRTKKTLAESDGDVAILYRTNRYSRAIENELLKNGIHYKMYKGLEFTKRMEVNLLRKLFHLSVNPRDLVAMERVLKHFCVGVGAAAVNKVNNYIETSGITSEGIYHGEGIPLKGKALKQFLWVMNLAKKIGSLPLKEVPQLIATAYIPSTISDWDSISYDDCEFADFSKKGEFCCDNFMTRLATFKPDKGERQRFEMRMGNLDELLCWLFSYSEREDGRDLGGFIQSMSIDASESNEDDEDSPRVHLMTVHGSKGLEFDNVFIVGCVNGMFPGLRDEVVDYNPMEEARRLFYVAMTRAKKELVITHPQTLPYGSAIDHEPSMFISEIEGYTNEIEVNEQGRRQKAFFARQKYY